MTPFEIDILLWYATRGIDHKVVEIEPPIWPETRDDFIANGLLVRSISTAYKITDKGRAYIKYLCEVPIPVCKWVLPEN